MKNSILKASVLALSFLAGSAAFAGDCSNPEFKWTQAAGKDSDSNISGEFQSECTFNTATPIDLSGLSQKLILGVESKSVEGTHPNRTQNGPQSYSTENTIRIDDAGDTRIFQKTSAIIQGTTLTYAITTTKVISQGNSFVKFVRRETHFTLTATGEESGHIIYKSSIAIKPGTLAPDKKVASGIAKSLPQAQAKEMADLMTSLN